MERVDKILVIQDLFSSRTKAQEAIELGHVWVIEGGERIQVKRASEKYKPDSQFRVQIDLNKYVSRAGLKLESAISELGLDVSGMIALDLGQSTGGFSDFFVTKWSHKGDWSGGGSRPASPKD